MSDPRPTPAPLIRPSAQSTPAPPGQPTASGPSLTSSTSSQLRRKAVPERRPFSWSRPFKFAFRPKVLFLGIIPAGLVLSFFDPLGLYGRVESGLEKRVRGPTPSLGQEVRRAGRPIVIVDTESEQRPSPSTDRCLLFGAGQHPLLRRHFSSFSSKPIKVLGLESSADDSCAAIVDSNRKIWSNVVIKQHETNAKWGGIHPREAQLAHAANMPKAIARAFSDSGLGINDIDVVAFTRGPGMPGCLHVCGNAARAIAAVNGKPVMGIHHMQAHTLTPLLTEPNPPAFPFLTLLVSGGHTQIVLATAWDKFEILADALDSRVGNAVDRIARYLQLPQRSDKGQGAMLEHYASLSPLPPYDTTPMDPMPVPMGRGMSGQRNLAFSFSGLTSHAERLIDELSGSTQGRQGDRDTQIETTKPQSISPRVSPGNAHDAVLEPEFRLRTAKTKVDEAIQREVSRVFQDAITTHIAQKVELCFELHSEKLSEVKGMVMSGGVASHCYLRSSIQRTLDDLPGRPVPVKLYFPRIELCTDNAAMIAWAALFRLDAGHTGDNYDLLTRPKWSLEELYDGR